MKKALQNELFAAGPLLFQKHEAQKGDPLQVQDAITRYGFECGNGWFGPIKEIILQLETYLGKLPEEVRGNYYPVQVKEKLGGLRFYMRSWDAEISSIYLAGQDKANTTCELCGNPGSLRNTKGWYKTLCDPHADPNFDLRWAIRESER